MNVVPEGRETTSQKRSENRVDLLSQIDEFRVKAERLQSALDARQEQAVELEQIVTEKKVKVEELDELIKSREAEAEVFSSVVRKEMDAVSEQFTTELENVDSSIKATVDEQNALLKGMTESLAEIQERLERVETTTNQLPETIHKESVQVYRNTHELIKHLEEHVDYIDEVDSHVQQSKAPAVIASIFSLISIGGIAFVILFLLGMIQI